MILANVSENEKLQAIDIESALGICHTKLSANTEKQQKRVRNTNNKKNTSKFILTALFNQ